MDPASFAEIRAMNAAFHRRVSGNVEPPVGNRPSRDWVRQQFRHCLLQFHQTGAMTFIKSVSEPVSDFASPMPTASRSSSRSNLSHGSSIRPDEWTATQSSPSELGPRGHLFSLDPHGWSAKESPSDSESASYDAWRTVQGQAPAKWASHQSGSESTDDAEIIGLQSNQLGVEKVGGWDRSSNEDNGPQPRQMCVDNMGGWDGSSNDSEDVAMSLVNGIHSSSPSISHASPEDADDAETSPPSSPSHLLQFVHTTTATTKPGLSVDVWASAFDELLFDASQLAVQPKYPTVALGLLTGSAQSGHLVLRGTQLLDVVDVTAATCMETVITTALRARTSDVRGLVVASFGAGVLLPRAVVVALSRLALRSVQALPLEIIACLDVVKSQPRRPSFELHALGNSFPTLEFDVIGAEEGENP